MTCPWAKLVGGEGGDQVKIRIGRTLGVGLAVSVVGVLGAGAALDIGATDRTVRHVDGEGPLTFESGVSSRMIVALDPDDAGATFGLMQPCVTDNGGSIHIEDVQPAGWVGDPASVEFGGAWLWDRSEAAMPFIALAEFPPEQVARIARESLVDVAGAEVAGACPASHEPQGAREAARDGKVLDLLVGVVPTGDDADGAIDGVAVHYQREGQRYVVTIDTVIGMCGANHTTPDSCSAAATTR